MSVLEFRPRWWLIASAWVVFAVSLPFAAWFGQKGHETFWWVFGRDAVQAVGAAALAVGGGAALLRNVVNRRWKRELQIMAVDLLDETIYSLGVVAQRLAYVLFGSDTKVGETLHAFQLPWTFVDEATIASAKTAIDDAYIATKDEPEVVTRLRATSSDLTDLGSKLRDSTDGLDRCLRDPKPVLGLMAGVAELNRRIRLLAYEVPSSETLYPPPPRHISQLAYETLSEAMIVAGEVRAPFKEIRADLSDEDLKKRLDNQEQELRMTEALDRGLKNLREIGTQIDQVVQKRDKLVRETSSAAQLARELSQGLAEDRKGLDLTEEETKQAEDFESKIKTLENTLDAMVKMQAVFSQPGPESLALSGETEERGRRDGQPDSGAG
jgi:hypothetical protein